MSSKQANAGFMSKLTTFIVDKRGLFFLFYIAALLFSVIAISWAKVENDVTVYLSEDSETRQGLTAMNENFVTVGTARVMVSNITYDKAVELYDQIAEIKELAMVSFDNTEKHYRDASALYELTFTGGAMDDATIEAMERIRAIVADYDFVVDTTIGYNEIDMLHEEMGSILIVAVVIIITVLVLTSRAYAEVLVLLLTFGAAALLNMGTNFIFEKVSFISDSVAVVLQLALAIDYAIILCHRFSDEHETKPAREACISALSKAIPEISASSMTTISGLAALGFMEFGIGLDMAMVLVKSIFLSLLSVFTLMPGLLMLFSGLIEKTKHKKLLPNITWLGKFAVKVRHVLPIGFCLLLVGAFYLSSHCPYSYNYFEMKTAKMTEQQTAYFKIQDTYGVSNMVALLVPSGDYEAEKAILTELSDCDEVESTMGLSNIEVMNGYTLTDALTARELSELIGLDYEIVETLYGVYAAQESQYGEILTGLDQYRVPLFDIFIFLKDQLDTYNISLESDMGGMSMGEMLGQLENAQRQLQNENYSRMVLYLNLPLESDETFSFLQHIRDVAGQYYEGDYYVIGNSTSSRDLASSFSKDNLLITLLSVSFVIIVLLLTFKSVGLSVLLILVIQGSIWINFSFPTLMYQPLYFLGYLVVNALQMGANIDYAIVISSHYQEKKQTMSYKKAIIAALNAAFPTVFTSGTMMAAAGLLIGNMSAQPVIAILGTCIGRGTIISVILVLVVLPSILVLGDAIIERTRFRFKKHTPPIKAATGTMRVNGHVRGYVSGVLDGDFSGVIHGQLNAAVTTDESLPNIVTDSEESDETKGEETDA